MIFKFFESYNNLLIYLISLKILDDFNIHDIYMSIDFPNILCINTKDSIISHVPKDEIKEFNKYYNSLWD